MPNKNGKVYTVVLDQSDVRKVDAQAKEIGWSRSEFISWAIYHFTECKEGLNAFRNFPISDLMGLKRKRAEENKNVK